MAINAVFNSLTGPGGQYSGASTSFGGQDGQAGNARNGLPTASKARANTLAHHGGETGSTAGERYGFCPAWYRRYRANR